MSHDDFDFEPIRGLPKELPKGEQLLWQGSPGWITHAIHAYHVRKVVIYFALLVLWRIGVGIGAGQPAHTVVVSCTLIGVLGMVAAGVLSLLAFLSARSTVYTITSERVVLRHGIAIPITMNVPFSLLESADLKLRGKGAGDIAMRVRADQRIGYLITWPHVRPGRITKPEPSFRSLPDVKQAADILAKAMLAYSGANAVQIELGGTAAKAPRVGSHTPAAA